MHFTFVAFLYFPMNTNTSYQNRRQCARRNVNNECSPNVVMNALATA